MVWDRRYVVNGSGGDLYDRGRSGTLCPVWSKRGTRPDTNQRVGLSETEREVVEQMVSRTLFGHGFRMTRRSWSVTGTKFLVRVVPR